MEVNFSKPKDGVTVEEHRIAVKDAFNMVFALDGVLVRNP